MADIVALVADHAGFELKGSLRGVLGWHGGSVPAPGARPIGPGVAREHLLTSANAPCAGGRHARRAAGISVSVP